MKRHVLLLSLLFSVSAVAQTESTAETRGSASNENNSVNGSNNGIDATTSFRLRQGSASVDECSTALAAQPTVTVPPGTTKVLYKLNTPAEGQVVLPDITSGRNGYEFCRGLEGVAEGFGSRLNSQDMKVSQDRKISCVKTAGITADWESCRSAVGMYDTILVAEAAMQIFQGVQTNNVQNKAQDQYNQEAAKGNAQNAAYDAQVTAMRSAKALNEQQAAAYAAAVAALYSKLQGWIKEDNDAVSMKACDGKKAEQLNVQPNVVYTSVGSIVAKEVCAKSIPDAIKRYRNEMFANKDAKASLTTAAMMFAAKAIAAGIKASQLGSIAKQVEDAKNASEDPYNPATFEYCQVNSADPRCAGSSTITDGSGLQDGGFSFGDSFGNNAFSPLGPQDQLGDGELAPIADNEAIPDASNPFTEDAKLANSILDPASAASIQPGGAGGGGGGGAPGLGGGSASLDNDVPGVDDSKKESEIKSNKASGNYNVAGGGSFQAVKPMKDENPFANLFDGKGGKLEEDRSIASGDIDGQDSGLFAKISKRYGQVQADKRIEAKNLNE